MNDFWNKYPSISGDLQTVTNILMKNMKSGEGKMNSILKDILDSEGKMLRPAFVILAGRLGDYNPDRLYTMAAVIEMLHMSTLIHDDIIDDSNLRRGQPTIQAKYGKNYAVFMGDFLFTKCFMLLSQNTSMNNMENVSKAIASVCSGEISQFSSLFSLDLSVKRYLKRIAGKTAALFSLSFYVGAYEGKCNEKQCKTLGRIGYNIGMAFQIIDDILDYEGNAKTVGKPIGNDIREGIFNLPLIYAYQANNKRLKSILMNNSFKASDITDLINLCIEFGGIEKSKALAKRYTQRALEAISTLPSGESKDILLEVSKKLLLREY
jgi:heptaprenyl diphosphate synthase